MAVKEVAEKIAEGVKNTAPEAAAKINDAKKPVEEVGKDLAAAEAKPGEANKADAEKTAQAADMAAEKLADAAKVQRQVDDSAPKTVVVPVVDKRPKAEEAAAARQYKVIVKNPTSGEDFLAAVQQVMKAKANKS